MPRKKKAEATEAKPKKPEIEWRTDRPERPGLYDCIISKDGNEQRATLQFKKCPFTGRKYWLYVDGSDVDPNAEVKWHDGKLFTD